MSWRLWVPLFAFAAFVGLAAYQLTQPKDDFVQSGMVGQPLPYFDLPPVSDGVEGVTSGTLADGETRVLNIGASWCLPCVVEARQLEGLD